MMSAQTAKLDPFPSFVSDLAATPICRRQLHDELLTHLRDVIIGGELPEDSKIPEKELCDRFGVSRTPLREALKVLAFEGLVILNHNRGAVVKALTIADLDETFPIYARLEALAGELACEHISQRDIDAMRRLHDEMVSSVRRHDLGNALAVNEKIHTSIQTGSRNRTLIQLLRYVSSRVQRARRVATPRDTALDWAINEHEQIMAALETRDPAKLSGAIREHVESTCRVLKNAWESRTSASEAANTSKTVRAAWG
jgi:DNA-binding GntR family transcriptional regulator